MIPKRIHYCWFGGKELPKSAKNCIASWRKYLPDYEIRRWDESNFDVEAIPYTKEAYEAKKYAFVSDYARFKILYEEGGIYFDTDVEVIKPMDDIIAAGPFMGCENHAIFSATPDSLGVNSGLGLGAVHGLGIYKEILDLYKTLHFRKKNGGLNTKTVVEYTTECLMRKGLINTPAIQEVAGVKIYPVDYFCPIDFVSGKISITPNTRTIHHFSGSWQPLWKKMLLRLWLPLSVRYPSMKSLLRKTRV